MNIAEAIRAMVVSGGVSSVFVISSPNSSGETVVITPYSGESISGTAAGWQSFQILVAAPTFPASEDLAWRAFRAIVGKRILGADRQPIGEIVDIQEPFYLAQDDNNRYIHVFNVTVPAHWKGE